MNDNGILPAIAEEGQPARLSFSHVFKSADMLYTVYRICTGRGLVSMRERLVSLLTNDEKRKELQYISVFALLGAISAVMTVMNIFTHKGALTVATAVFAVLCLVNYLLVRKGKARGTTIASCLFGIEIVSLFVFFIISGNPEGFSVIWIAMLPTCGMLLFGRKRATIICAVMFAVLAFFFWLPAGRSLLQYDYNPTYMMRFPVLYVAFFLISVLLETIRATTQRELDRLRDKYRYYAAHDYLTNLLNRQGLEEWYSSHAHPGERAAMMVDIDHFKNVNDSYGHEIGDLVLASVARELDCLSSAKVCRWGGEEFVVWFDDSADMCDPETIRARIENMDILIPDTAKAVHVTVSVGVAKGSGEMKTLVREADEAMLRAKANGRNRVEYSGAC